MTLERTELLVPMRLELIEPRLERQHRFPPKVKDTQARVARGALVRDQARLEKDPQVAAHDGRGRTGDVSQLPGTVRSVTEHLDDAPPRRVGERMEETLHVVGHLSNS